MFFIFDNNALFIKKRTLSNFERDIMFPNIMQIFSFIPFKCHTYNYMYILPYCQGIHSIKPKVTGTRFEVAATLTGISAGIDLWVALKKSLTLCGLGEKNSVSQGD